MFAVHVRGNFLMTKAVLPSMLARGDGVIVNIASQLGQIGGVELVHYAGAQGRDHRYDEVACREVSSRGVRQCRGAGTDQYAACPGLSEEVART